MGPRDPLGPFAGDRPPRSEIRTRGSRAADQRRREAWAAKRGRGAAARRSACGLRRARGRAARAARRARPSRRSLRRGGRSCVPLPCVILGSASRYFRPSRYIAACPSGSAAAMRSMRLRLGVRHREPRRRRDPGRGGSLRPSRPRRAAPAPRARPRTRGSPRAWSPRRSVTAARRSRSARICSSIDCWMSRGGSIACSSTRVTSTPQPIDASSITSRMRRVDHVAAGERLVELHLADDVAQRRAGERLERVREVLHRVRRLLRIGDAVVDAPRRCRW